MALTRLTPAIADKVAKAMNLSPINIRAAINAGTIQGLKISDRIYMIDDSLVPKDGQIPETAKVEVVPIQDDNTLEIDRLIAYAEKQKVLADKYKQLQEARGQRDKPEILKEKEAHLKELETTLNSRQIALDQKEQTLKQLEYDLIEQSKNTNRDCASQLTVVGQKYKLISDQTDQLIKERQKTIDSLDQQIIIQTTKLDGILEIISQYPEVISPIIATIQKYIKVVDYKAIKESQLSEITKGDIGNRHISNANYGWSIVDKLNQVLRWLNR